MSAAPDHEFVRLSPVELQLGLPIDRRPSSVVPRPSGERGRSARIVLEDLLRAALLSAPCYVTFSGGRDSSALLAIAVHVARRDGLDPPVPVTAVYPDAPSSDETDWQQRVIDHLGVRERVVVTIREEQRLLSEGATSAIRGRGLAWPEATQLQRPLLAGLERGASLVSGEGGDNVIAGGRAAAVRHVLRARLPRRSALRAAARAIAPGRPRATGPCWYTAEASDRVAAAVGTVHEPLRWDRRTSAVLDSPAAQVLFPNVRACIAEHGLAPLLPFVDSEFLTALSRDGGRLGMGGRTRLFDHLVGDLLPGDVVARRSKASFNETRWGEAEREFARSWDGRGSDPRWIDAERLREQWLSSSPHPASDFMLHVAWAASTRVAHVGMTVAEHEDGADDTPDAR